VSANDNWEPVGFYSIRAVVMNCDSLSKALDNLEGYYSIVGYSAEQTVAGQSRAALPHRTGLLCGRAPTMADAVFCICAICDEDGIGFREFMETVATFCRENTAQEMLCVAEDLAALRAEYAGRLQ
jgi:hypothetical protein